jgi:hypothetical protein
MLNGKVKKIGEWRPTSTGDLKKVLATRRLSKTCVVYGLGLAIFLCDLV